MFGFDDIDRIFQAMLGEHDDKKLLAVSPETQEKLDKLKDLVGESSSLAKRMERLRKEADLASEDAWEAVKEEFPDYKGYRMYMDPETGQVYLLMKDGEPIES